ncbi:MAG: tRNA guanosine(15) transglycosylase TgtA [Metallosphaera sp.]|nr:tRNA guanosine(15) transglycosylase TgtA [Metallosphaera cuprina]
MGDFEIKDEDLAARIGVLETKHGKLETPSFFPVVNPLRNDISIKELNSIGFYNFITNAYILKKNNLLNGNIHNKFEENNIIMTDSGAYQILEYGEISQENKDIVSYQVEIKPDIGVFLDVPTGNTDDWNEAKKSVELTLERGREIIEVIRENQDIIWTHPIQGGPFLDLIEYSSKQASKIPEFKMLALGSPTVFMEKYRYSKLIEMIYTAKSNVSRGIPFHLFGGGVPHLIPFAVALGVDTFDSASYILFARDNRYLTRERTYRLEELDYFPCSCPVCSRYTPKELAEMKSGERSKLLAIHNLWKIREEMNAVKQAIREGRLFEYIQQKAYSHPALYNAFKSILKYSRYLEKYDPRVKGSVKGVLLFNSDSIDRPEILRHVEFMKVFVPKKRNALVICGDKLNSPFILDPKVKSILSKNRGTDVFVALPFYGLIPVSTSESFPMSQFEMPEEVDKLTLEKTVSFIQSFLKDKNYEEIKFIECEKSVLSHVMSINTALG